MRMACSIGVTKILPSPILPVLAALVMASITASSIHAALITALDTGLLRIKLNDKWTPIILCGGLAEIDRNRVTVLVNDVEELTNVELSEATKELEKATSAVEDAETSKARLDASVELKKATARLEAINYLS